MQQPTYAKGIEGVVVAESEQGRGVMGVIDGSPPRGVEDQDGIAWRKNLLRTIGYKL